MLRARVALLSGLACGCGFHASSGMQGDDSGSNMRVDGGAPGDGSAAKSNVCVQLKDPTNNVDWSGCATVPPADKIDVQSSTMLDTSAGTSQPAGLTCVPISVTLKVQGNTEMLDICALAATSITVRADATLRAFGGKPVVLVGDTVDLEGTIDVASHGIVRGAGSNTPGCSNAMAAVADGGGAGGSFGLVGGNGGDQGGNPASHGVAAATISASYFRGGCDGAPGGDGTGAPAGNGGLGGGAVWIASRMLTLGSQSVINASGAGGLGGKQQHYGGSGGGAGGMIVLQATTIARQSAARIFANGGHGGGGDGDLPGQDGGDPDTVSSGGGGGGGDGGGQGGSNNGDGGRGYRGSTAAETGNDGANNSGGFGGGGGGGGGGVVRVASATNIGDSNVSPNPVLWKPVP